MQIFKTALLQYLPKPNGGKGFVFYCLLTNKFFNLYLASRRIFLILGLRVGVHYHTFGGKDMMDKAMWLAGVFGPLLTIIGLWMLLYSENLIKVMTSVKNTPGVFFMMGTINMLIGLVIVNMYNVWMWHPAVLISLLGWVFLIRGVLILYIPQLIIKYTMTNHMVMRAVGLIPLIWGLALWWFAFFR